MKKTDEKGITLIALVITIIVMLILVGVTVNMVVQGGLFERAGYAARGTNKRVEEEKKLANGDIVDYYLNGGYTATETVEGLPPYSEVEKNNGVLTSNAKYETAVIPKGFKYVEGTVANGLVIEDAEENQYVWIPVKTGEFTRTGWWKNEPTDKTYEELINSLTDEEIKEYLAHYNGCETIEQWIEEGEYSTAEDILEESGFDTWEELLRDDNVLYLCLLDSYSYTESLPTEITTSVATYGGFYIGRYEAGSETVRTSSSTLTTPQSKKGLYPYNYVSYTNAKTKTEELYTDAEEYGVVATLPYGVQWDSMLRFLKSSVDVTNSVKWGNYTNHEFQFTGRYLIDGESTWTETTNKMKPKGDNWLLTTGASETNKAKNIYDVAGNACEWTNEAGETSYYICRGSWFSDRGDIYSAVVRSQYSTSDCYRIFSFRPALYVAPDAGE